ncbi:MULTISPECIES: sigma-E processing peptidase SpoIIGA [unclassified Ruminococcus]|uniref:sigma-E processing peptidase SpoIIGA n=1 Tax=unclassified Ruminococcus TaxID=2608920 RepID=UPI0021097540|nr:hypothetical protein [Ruminococcus sp. zg-924]MCQ4114882.1 hypothetical protein [Ruminococcus sp. zg-921]
MIFIKRVIYIDVLICLNLIINYFILVSVGRMLSRNVRQLRLIFGALFGAFCSLIILLPPMNSVISFAVKLIVSLLICLISFKYGGIKSLLKNTAAFFMISFLFCGVMIALWFTFTPKGMVINNSTVYFNISPLLLIVSSLVTYSVVRLVCRITGRKKPQELYYTVKILRSGNEAILKGKLDTGCSLVEPFSGSPVIVCEKEKIKSIIPENILEYEKCLACCAKPEKIRLIPYSTIKGNGLLPSFKPDRVFIGESLCLNEIFIAVSSRGITESEIGCIINPQCLD